MACTSSALLTFSYGHTPTQGQLPVHHTLYIGLLRLPQGITHVVDLQAANDGVMLQCGRRISRYRKRHRRGLLAMPTSPGAPHHHQHWYRYVLRQHLHGILIAEPGSSSTDKALED
jgi:hypothetical protein